MQLRCTIVDVDDPFLDVARALPEEGGVIAAGMARNSAEAVQCVEAVSFSKRADRR
jgi:hypothetical protein